MKIRTAGLVLAGLLILVGEGQAALFGPKGDDPEEKRASVRAQSDEMLAELYKSRPEMKKKLAGAAGYATFKQTDMNLFLLASANGYGMLVDNKTKQETFMRVASLGGGAGMGVKDVRVVFVFNDAKLMHQFVDEGWQFGAKADVSAKHGESGMAAEQNVKSVVGSEGGATATSGDVRSSTGERGATGTGGGMEIFQFTESGISFQATVAGTKYWKDSKLNP